MAELTIFPNDCRTLIVEPEPLQAMTLECLLDDFGCCRMGPVGSLAEVERALGEHRPSMALVSVDLDDELGPVTALLDREQIAFALLAIGPANTLLDQSKTLRSRPRVRRPFHAPALHAAMCGLYQDNLSRTIATADRRIAQGQLRLANQLRLIEELAAKGQETEQAHALAREFGRLLQTMRTSRGRLARRLETFADARTPF